MEQFRIYGMEELINIILGKQTIDRLKCFIDEKQQEFPNFLQDIQQDLSNSRAEEHVIRNIESKEGKTKIEDLRQRILKEKHDTLFFIVHDEAHHHHHHGG